MCDSILTSNIALINDGIKFSSKSGDNFEIITDYYPPLGQNEGYKPLELFLISFGTCFSGTILPVLRNMKKKIDYYELQVSGQRKEEHPTSFIKITLDFTISSVNLNEQELLTAVNLAEKKYCPVWAMLDNSIEVDIQYRIE